MSEKNNAIKTALYRTHRPFDFVDVVGQDHIVKVLENSIHSGRVSHAYLFAGSRGTGKTSVARIFARALGTTENDIYEIDAASNRGIDDIRAIRDGVAVLPLESRYKVYIIDEAHMLTKEAFNALLKTLEEPPSHAIFILATTELDKVPETIVSRCQSFSFKRPSREILREVATNVAKKEGFALEAGVADLIAISGDGSFRDMLGTLQKVIGAGDSSDTSDASGVSGTSEVSKKGSKNKGTSKITLAEAELVIGAPKNSLVNDFVVAFANKNSAGALAAIAAADSAGIDMKMFIARALEKMRFALLYKNMKGVGNTAGAGMGAGAGTGSNAGIGNSRGELEKNMTEHMSAEDAALLGSLTVTSGMLATLLRVYDETSQAYIPTLPLELAVLALGA